jgi:Ca2+-binding EF-hand superfamily protein
MGNNHSCLGEDDVGQQPVLMSQESVDFVIEKTQATKEEVQAYYDNFLKEYPDGKMDNKGFREMMKKGFPDQDIGKLEKHIFRMFDANNNGKIDFREFMVVLTVISKGTPQENLEQIFRIFDANNDGTVSKKELYRIVKDLYSILVKEDNPTQATDKFLAEAAFKEMDTDGDSKVTKEEFIRACIANEKITSMLALKIVDIFI